MHEEEGSAVNFYKLKPAKSSWQMSIMFHSAWDNLATKPINLFQDKQYRGANTSAVRWETWKWFKANISWTVKLIKKNLLCLSINPQFLLFCACRLKISRVLDWACKFLQRSISLVATFSLKLVTWPFLSNNIFN